MNPPNNSNNNTKKFRMVSGLLCMSVQAVAETMGIDMKSAENTVWKGLERYRKQGGAWMHFTDQDDERRKWISYEHLPEMTRLRVAYKYNEDVWAAYYQECLLDDAVGLIEPGDATFFHDLGLYSIAQVGQLAEACGWLRLCSPAQWWANKFGGKVAAMQAATQVLQGRNLYGLKVSNWQSLELKCKRWREQERNSLVSGYFGNNNKSKVREVGNLPIRRIIDLYAHPSKLKHSEVSDIYNREAAERGWPRYTQERIRQILEANEDAWIYSRQGVQAARSIKERHLKRRRPEYADQLWTVDGTTLQLGMNREGEFRKAWTIVVIADSYSDCMLGWAAGSTETQELVLRALRMAIRRRGNGPTFVQFDNGSAQTSRQVLELYERMNAHGIAAQPYNGKSKYIERILGRLEQGFLRHFGNFYGGNITARSLDSRANPDYVAQQLKNDALPVDATALLEQLQLAIEVYNNTEIKKRKASPAQLYNTPDDRRRVIPYLDMVSLFWVKRPEAARYNPGGIMIQVDKVRHEYEVQTQPGLVDENFLKEHSGDSFVVRYDPDNLSTIALYDKADRYIASAQRKYEFAAVPTEGEGELLRRALEQRKAQVSEGIQASKEIREEMATAGLEEVSFQLVHKDTLYAIENDLAARLLAANAVDTDRYTNTSTSKRDNGRPERRSPYFDPAAAQRLLNMPDIDEL